MKGFKITYKLVPNTKFILKKQKLKSCLKTKKPTKNNKSWLPKVKNHLYKLTEFIKHCKRLMKY